jgi:thymidine kinase
MAVNKPTPKSQQQLSEETVDPLIKGSQSFATNRKKRELQRTVKADDTAKFSIGIRDIDEAIFYYFENVIKLSVVQNSLQKKVPILYGSP